MADVREGTERREKGLMWRALSRGRTLIYRDFCGGYSRRAWHWLSTGHLIRLRRIRVWMKAAEKRFVQVGGGKHVKHGYGWLNGDLIAGDIYLNARRKLPFPDSSVDVIFTEHFFEHLPQHQALAFLDEAYRVLKPGGILRQSTPDLEGLISVYRDENPKVSADDAIGRHMTNHRKRAVYARRTPCQFFNDVMRMWGHEFIYDRQMLREITLEAGFKELRWVPFGESPSDQRRNLESHADVDWLKDGYVCIYEAKK